MDIKRDGLRDPRIIVSVSGDVNLTGNPFVAQGQRGAADSAKGTDDAGCGFVAQGLDLGDSEASPQEPRPSHQWYTGRAPATLAVAEFSQHRCRREAKLHRPAPAIATCDKGIVAHYNLSFSP